MPKNG